MKKIIKEYWTFVLIDIILIALGLFLIFADEELIQRLLTYFIGGIFILIGLKALITGIKSKNKEIKITKFVETAIDISLGIILMVIIKKPMTIYLGLVFVVLPIVRVILSERKDLQAIKEIPYFLLGFFFIVFSPDAMVKGFFVLIGAVFVILGIFLAFSIYEMTKNPKIQQVFTYDDNEYKKEEKTERIIIDSHDHKEL